MKRIAVTGIGCLSPLGFNVASNWKNLLGSRSSLSFIENISLESGLASNVKVISEIKNLDILPREKGSLYGIDSIPMGIRMSDHIPAKDLKKLDNFISYGILAADEALHDSGWFPEDQDDRLRTAVVLGSGIGGITSLEGNCRKVIAGNSKLSPFFLPSILINLLSGQVSIKYGFLGPNSGVVSACSTGAHSIHYGSELIRSGMADVAVCGGSESTTASEIAIAGFSAARALSRRQNDPRSASRPWDKGRDGFVMSEGSGVLILEEMEHAKRRGAKIYAEFIGAGLTGDAHHITAPHPEGLGARKAVEILLKNHGVSVDEIDYINAHGTSTPAGDMAELRSMESVFSGRTKKDKLLMSSTKSAVGHMLGAAGSYEAIVCIKSLIDGVAPPTLNLDDPEDHLDFIDLVPHDPKERKINYALSNSFGFGGTNISLLFKRLD